MSDQSAQPDPVVKSVADLRAIIKRVGRDDLERRVTAAAARLKRSSTIVCVVGEFKQGKSSLLNGLLGRDLLPVDDDLATSAITLVQHGERPKAVVRRRQDGELLREEIPADSLADWASESGNPRNAKDVERVELSAPAKVLQQGLVLVDTPGMGGLGAGHAAATQAFLPFADGLVLVSDASAELSAPEVEFMRTATELCPTVMFVQTKTDLYPEWERIFALNKGHLDRAGIQVPMLATSAALRMAALGRKDRDLNDRSGYAALIKALVDQVVAPARASARQRSMDDVATVAALLRSTVAEEKSALTNPEEREKALARLQEANGALENLRGSGSRWQIALNDGISDLSSTVMHKMRSDFRSITDGIEDRVEVMKKQAEWDQMSRDMQTEVAEVVSWAFNAIVEGAGELRGELIDLINDEQLAIGPGLETGGTFDITRFWKDKGLDGPDADSKAKSVFKTGFTGLRGAQGGVLMFGMMGRFLPAAAGTLLASNPVLIAAGGAFGGFQLMEERKRKLNQRRQQARTLARKFVDNTQFEVGNELSQLVKQYQRGMRDEFSAGIAELQRSYTESINQIKQSQQASDAERKQRLEQLSTLSKALDGIGQRMQGARK